MAPGADSPQLCLRLLLLAPPLSAPRDFAGWIAVASLKGNTTRGVLSTLLGHVRALAAFHRLLDFFVAVTIVCCCLLALVPFEDPTTDFNPTCLWREHMSDGLRGLEAFAGAMGAKDASLTPPACWLLKESL